MSMSVEEELAFGMENIGLKRDEIKRRIDWVSEITSLKELLDKSPYDISGGQKQRVAIASVLSMQPKIMILDEPTSMLDPVGKDSIFNICEKMKNELNMTVIMVEHTIDRLARLSDKMTALNKATYMMEDMVNQYGLSKRLASIRSVNLDVLNIEKDKEN